MFFYNGKEKGTKEFGAASVVENSIILDFNL
jgi:hypothetical protein